MREFIKECLENLESLTGLRQLFFLEQREDGAKQIQIVINGIMDALSDYKFIPEEAQQRIIRQMMVKDQNYESLNSRVVTKWLEANKGRWYFSTPKISEEELTPAPPEVADKYAKQLLEAIEKVGNPEYKNGMKEIREKNGYGKALSVGVIKNYEIGQTCSACNGEGFLVEIDAECCEEFINSICCNKPNQIQTPKKCENCNGEGKINIVSIPATSEEEARKQYTELFGS